MRYSPFALLPFLLALAACGPAETSQPAAPEDDSTADNWQTVQDSTSRNAAVEGFSGPEAVRDDPDQDVYFVANFNGAPAGDANGFISRVGADGTVEEFQFMTGTEEAPLHAPRGMFITGDTLWAADADGVHGFDRRSGAQLAFVDFTAQSPGFLNDIAVGPDGALYVTDTGASRLYRMLGEEISVVVDDTLLVPNGVAFDEDGGRLVFAPWGGSQSIRAWAPGASSLEEFGTSPGGNFDGIEVVGDRILIASQVDSTLHVLEDGRGRALIRVPGRPADIGVDTRRGRVAVPYIALNRVDIWALPRD
jgi:hypothetical protein